MCMSCRKKQAARLSATWAAWKKTTAKAADQEIRADSAAGAALKHRVRAGLAFWSQLAADRKVQSCKLIWHTNGRQAQTQCLAKDTGQKLWQLPCSSAGPGWPGVLEPAGDCLQGQTLLQCTLMF